MKKFIPVLGIIVLTAIVVSMFWRWSFIRDGSEDTRKEVVVYGPATTTSGTIITTPKQNTASMETKKKSTVLIPAVDGFGTRREFVELMNIERSDNGLPKYVEHVSLDNAAQNKAEDMVRNGYFAHTAPDGRTHEDFIQETGYAFSYSGENLSQGFGSPKEVHMAFMNSPKHRGNILDSDFTEIGIGIAEDSKGTWYVVEMFAKPADN